MRKWCILMLLASLLVATSAPATKGYIVILKNKKMLRARQPIEVVGDKAMITLVTGTLASYPLDKVDLVETERYNQLRLGDAILIDELTIDAAPQATPTPRIPLGEYASITAGDAMLGSTLDPTPTPTPGIRLHSRAYHNSRITDAFAAFFEERTLYIYRFSVGTQPDYLFVQMITDNEREVFKVLEAVAEAFAAVHELHERIAPAAVELEMVSTSGRPAGTFRITPGMARSLASGDVPVEQFYVSNVIF